MSVFRIIARLEIKPPNLVKGIHLEGLRKIGDPAKFARTYYQAGLDEIFFQDIMATLYESPGIHRLLTDLASDVFVPITVGGGIASLSDAQALIRSGADKISVNSAGVQNPSLLSEISRSLGAQALVVTVEAKRVGNSWEVLTHSGRESSGLLMEDWLAELELLGAGEILLCSVDKDGTTQGFDADLLSAARASTRLPLIASGGFRGIEDAILAHGLGFQGIAIAKALHSGMLTISDLKSGLRDHKIEVR